MIKINLLVGSRYLVDRKKIKMAAQDLLKENKLDNVEIDVAVVGQRKMKLLNESKLKRKGATDVLSFPMFKNKKLDNFPQPKDQLIHLGDIFISFPEAVKTAKRYGKMVDDQICFYLKHGLMHLMGYHHD
ncbi:MAG: rRNA maturation RNase YbeY [Candidatus Woesebacteria bacterium]|jgi:probable rRNA maturation factor